MIYQLRFQTFSTLTLNNVLSFKVPRDLMNWWLADSIFYSHNWIYHQISTQVCLKHLENVSVMVKFNWKYVTCNLKHSWNMWCVFGESILPGDLFKTVFSFIYQRRKFMNWHYWENYPAEKELQFLKNV